MIRALPESKGVNTLRFLFVADPVQYIILSRKIAGTRCATLSWHGEVSAPGAVKIPAWKTVSTRCGKKHWPGERSAPGAEDLHEHLLITCKKSPVADKKNPFSRLAKSENQKSRLLRDEEFSNKRNAENGVFLPTLIKTVGLHNRKTVNICL